MRLVDTHAHLVAEAFAADAGEVVRRAKEAGVVAIVCVGDSIPASHAAARFAEEHDQVWASAGIHPHQAGRAPEGFVAELRPLFEHPKVVAVGEVGLDYHYDFVPAEVQQEVFRAQVRLAVEIGKPLIVHNRNADADVLRILAEEDAGRAGGVLHCFWSDLRTAHTALEMGFYLGVGGPVTFKNAGELRTVLSELPLERLVVETDSPYLAPVPHRGRRNEPAWVVEAARALADVKGVDLAGVADVTTANAARLFGLELAEQAV